MLKTHILKTVKGFLSPTIIDNDKIMEWKLNAYYRTVVWGLLPLITPFIIFFSLISFWKLFIEVAVVAIVLFISATIAKAKHLSLAVNTALAVASLSAFYFLIYLHINDSLIYTVFMIIIAGIFLGTKTAFIWAGIQTTILVVIAYISDDFTILPNLTFFRNNPIIALNQKYFFSTIIFLYIGGALLSILFERYFSDLLRKVKRAHDEKMLLESELFQAQRLESIGLLAGGIAHDFGHWLTSIKSCASLILKKFSQVDPDLSKYAQNIYDTCNIVSGSIIKLQTSFRKTKTEILLVNIHDVLDSIHSLLCYMLDKNIEIRKDLYASRSMIKGNFSQLQNVFMNLAVNASDAMPEGGVLTFATALKYIDNQPVSNAGSETHIVITISDTGFGINDVTKEKLFTPFFTTKEMGKGTGLGLSTAKRIINTYKGEIRVDSEPGKGTSFMIYLPLAQKDTNLQD